MNRTLKAESAEERAEFNEEEKMKLMVQLYVRRLKTLLCPFYIYIYIYLIFCPFYPVCSVDGAEGRLHV